MGLRTILASISGVKVIAEAAALVEFSALPPNADILIVASLDSPANSWLASIIENYPAGSFLFLLNSSSIPHPLILPKGQLLGLMNLDATPGEIGAAIRALQAGLFIIDPKYMDKVQFAPGLSFVTSPSDHRPPSAGTDEEQDVNIEPLTPRETEILQALALGLTNKEIARQFSISEHTVKYHIDSVFSKLGVNNRTEAVRQGVHLGLIII